MILEKDMTDRISENNRRYAEFAWQRQIGFPVAITDSVCLAVENGWEDSRHDAILLAALSRAVQTVNRVTTRREVTEYMKEFNKKLEDCGYVIDERSAAIRIPKLEKSGLVIVSPLLEPGALLTQINSLARQSQLGQMMQLTQKVGEGLSMPVENLWPQVEQLFTIQPRVE